jgi:hypothetical protein
MLMGFQVNCQTISKEENKELVKTYINQEGDTMVVMSIESARILLEDVLNYEYTDMLLKEYMVRDSLNNETIEIQKNIIIDLSKKNENLETIVKNLKEVIDNKDSETNIKDEIIKQQKKEIRKQKLLKIVGFATTFILVIITVVN